MRCQVARHTLERGILLFKEGVYVGRDLILVPKNHVVILIYRFLSVIIHELHLGMDGHQHCGYLTGSGFEQYGVGVNRKYLAVENSISRLRILYDAIFCAGDEFANDGLSETLLDAIASRVIGKGGNSDGLPFRGQLGGVTRDVVAAARAGERGEKRDEPQQTMWSAMTMATAISQSVPPQS